jgi:hypothetical protein
MERWTDDRLDDLAYQVKSLQGEVDGLTNMRISLAEVAKDASEARHAAQSCASAVDSLKADMRRVAKEEHDDRLAARKYYVTTLVAVAGLIIAALAVFL